ILRLDLRQDLEHLELMKTWPVPPGALVRGEIVWPAALLTAITWAMILIGLVLSGVAFSRAGAAWRFSLGIAALMLAPALIFAQYAIHNAATVLFPAWVPLGRQRSRGVEAMGQRLLLLAATWLSLIILALPGTIIGGIVWFAARIV